MKIEIPYGLSQEDEAILITKQIAKKFKQRINSGSGKKKLKQIGEQKNFDSFQLPKEQIEIIRVLPPEKLPTFIKCFCGTLYSEKEGKHYYTNYGGMVRKKSCCGEECRQLVIDNYPERTAILKSKLKNICLY